MNKGISFLLNNKFCLILLISSLYFIVASNTNVLTNQKFNKVFTSDTGINAKKFYTMMSGVK